MSVLEAERLPLAKLLRLRDDLIDRNQRIADAVKAAASKGK